MLKEVWQEPETISWSQILLDSFAKVVGYELIVKLLRIQTAYYSYKEKTLKLSPSLPVTQSPSQS